MDALLQLLIVLLLTRLVGVGAERLGQSASVGELLAGVALAAFLVTFGASWSSPSALSLTDLPSSQTLQFVAQVGIFFLVLLAGIEMKPSEIARSSKGALAVASGGMALPLVAGGAVAWLVLPDSEYKAMLALVVGVSMAITAIPATVKVFSELGLLHTRLGEVVISASIGARRWPSAWACRRAVPWSWSF